MDCQNAGGQNASQICKGGQFCHEEVSEWETILQCLLLYQCAQHVFLSVLKRFHKVTYQF